MAVQNNPINISAETALHLLKDGNNRFVNNISRNRDLLRKVLETKEEQRPFAAILSCMDSRVPAELIFDLSIGDVFSVRIAGNIISENILGSLEYAVEVAGTKLIVVMGHTNCGAIKGACDDIHFGNLSTLIDKIIPAVHREKTVKENRNSGNHEFVDKVAELNVRHSVRMIQERSAIIKRHCEEHDVLVVPAMYDVASGTVRFNGEQPDNMIEDMPHKKSV